MANKYEKKEWEDRQSQYPSRRKLIPTTAESIYDVERAEGDVTVPGNAFDAQNMNDFEDRVYDAFGKLDATDIKVLDSANVFLGVNVEEVLKELFTSASDGKKAFANAIGGSASSTFQALADLAGSIKQDRDSGKQLIANAIGATRSGTASASESFSQLANRIKNDKMSFWSGGMPVNVDLQSLGVGVKSSKRINVNFGFKPSVVIIDSCHAVNYYRTNNMSSGDRDRETTFTSALTSMRTTYPTTSGTYIFIRDISESGFSVILENDADFSSFVTKNYSFLHIYDSATIYAFGNAV